MDSTTNLIARVQLSEKAKFNVILWILMLQNNNSNHIATLLKIYS